MLSISTKHTDGKYGEVGQQHTIQLDTILVLVNPHACNLWFMYRDSKDPNWVFHLSSLGDVSWNSINSSFSPRIPLPKGSTVCITQTKTG